MESQRDTMSAERMSTIDEFEMVDNKIEESIDQNEASDDHNGCIVASQEINTTEEIAGRSLLSHHDDAE